MKDDILVQYENKLAQLKAADNFRKFSCWQNDGLYLTKSNKRLLNLSSNDYLGIASTGRWVEDFFDTYQAQHTMRLSASSSRLLTGNFPAYEALEDSLVRLFGRSALVFNSGYHMNVGILPALCDDKTVILADKYSHASMIDGILLSKAKFHRFAHQNLAQLEQWLIRYQDDDNYNKIIVMTESIFSMDGDVSDLKALVALKQKYNKTLLYVDEAHAIGVVGECGLGVSEYDGVIDEIDFLVGTFGKACASLGGYLISAPVIRDYLINTMRPLIFSTALPPINVAWTQFVLEKLPELTKARQRLSAHSQTLIRHLKTLGVSCPSMSQIIPVVVGDNDAAIRLSQNLEALGFFAMPIRPPTVPKGQARVRLCLNSEISDDAYLALKNALTQSLTNTK